MELIDKDKVVKEIERIRTYYKSLQMVKQVYNSHIDNCNDLLDFLDTLEVKDIDLKKEIETHKNECLNVKFPTTDIELIKKDVEYTARKFFELGLSAQTSTAWHCVSEEIPTKFGEPIIVVSLNNNEEDGIWLYDLIQSWDGEWSPRVNWENPVKWAYVDDLLK